MAIGTLSDLKIYPDQFYGGFNEVVAQNGNAFNAASANTIRLFTEFARGNWTEEAFFDSVSGLISRRDITSTSDATSVKMSADSMIAPKLSRIIGPVENTIGSLRTAGYDLTTESGLQQYSFLLGQQVAEAAIVDFLNSGLYAAVAVTGKSANTSLSIVAASGTKTANYATGLVPLFQKFGDRAQELTALVMHSKPFFDLMGSNIAVATDRVAGATIYEGTVGTMGRPVVVTDSAALVKTDGGGTGINSYYTLALRQGGLDIRVTEDQLIHGDIKTGVKAGLVMVLQGEYAFNVKLLGYSYSASLSTPNPADATIGTGSNWTQVFASHKWTAGARLETL
jgi:hypothetical protein